MIHSTGLVLNVSSLCAHSKNICRQRGPVNLRPPTTVILQATTANNRKVNGLAGARSRACVCGRAFAGARSAHSPCIIYTLG